MEKLKNNEIIKLFNNNGYRIVGEIKNSVVPIICEKDGYRYRISYHNLSQGKNPSLWGFHNIDNLEYNINSLLKKRNSKTKFVSYEIIVKNKKKRILITFECECGKVFKKKLEDSAYGTYILCNDCKNKKRGMTRRKSKESIKTIVDNGYKIIENDIEEKNITSFDYVEVEDRDGFKGFISSNNIKTQKGMSKFDIRINKKNYVWNVNHYIELKGIDLECLSLVEKKHTRQSLLFRCSCGETFITSIASFQNGKTRCEKCSNYMSRYEREFEQYLKDNNVEYIYQYSLNQCRDILPLPFDFFLPKYNALVEIDGEGHYFVCNFNKISHEKAKKSFESTKKHDAIKSLFCEENNIPLLRIPYFNMKDGSYKTIFQDFIKGVANLG